MQDASASLVPQLALSLAQRPQLTERLLVVERRFNESKNLGEVLRQQQGLQDPPAARAPMAWLVAAVAVGVCVGMSLERVLE